MSLPDGLSRLWNLLYPNRCASCAALIVPGKKLCARCSNVFVEIDPPICTLCGHSETDCTCDTERTALPFLAAPFSYEGAARDALHRLKFRGERTLAGFFGDYMAKTASRELPVEEIDLVCCVPMTRAERKGRSYNQSELLARETAKLLKIPFAPRALRKASETERQHRLNAARRLENPRNAFRAERSIVSSCSVLLCDDIKATGATLNDCCRALNEAGAKEIFCLCAALTDGRPALSFK